MIEISQEEFNEKIEQLINEKISRAKLIKELETDSRTLNNKIQELSVYNPDLYLRFIKKFPYKSKSRDDIDFEALVVEIVKTDMTTSEATIKYNVGARTIRRNVVKLEKENPDLVRIYREVKDNNKHGRKKSVELQRKIDQLILRPVKINEVNENRKKQLEDMEKIFNSRCEHTSKEEAARSMGITANRMYKLLNELYRIKIEEAHIKKTENVSADFKKSLKVDNNTQPTIITQESNNVNNKEVKGIGE